MASFPSSTGAFARTASTLFVPPCSPSCCGVEPSSRSARTLRWRAQQPFLPFAIPRGTQCNYIQHARRSVVRAAYQQEPSDPRARRAAVDRPPWEQVSSYDYPPPPSGAYGQQPPPPTPPNGGGSNGDGGGGGMSNATKAVIVAAFILGVGAGTWFDSEATFAPQNVASTQIIDRRTPNSEVCMANGYSSMVFDQRIFVSFNPFNVYVSQPEVKPGCVLRRSNVNVLESRGLVQGKEVNQCKNRMNTFAFVGDLDNSPEVSCVYHSEDAENQFLKNPSSAVLGDGYAGNGGGGPAASSAQP